jgi:hypothetical protein
MKSPLHMEALTAVSIVLKGYYYPGGADYQTYGSMLTGGPGGAPAVMPVSTSIETTPATR